jgi:type I restriction-modification system DNA methylase subunit
LRLAQTPELNAQSALSHALDANFKIQQNSFMIMLRGKEAVSVELGVSLATVNNWIKTQVIPPPGIQDQYTKETFTNIVNNIEKSARLNSRANRRLSKNKYICYLDINQKNRKKQLDELAAAFENSNLSIDEGVLALSFAVLRSNNFIKNNWETNTKTKIDSLLSEWITKSKNPALVKNFYSDKKIENKDDDILGAFYQSIMSISQKSNKGSYYTPHSLLSGITIKNNKKILDPCCGSGGILLKVLSKKHETSAVFARDIDELALKICFINLSLFFNTKNLDANIQKYDIAFDHPADLFLQDKSKKNEQSEKFDFIITNPPWGGKYTKQEKHSLLKLYPELKTSEIFSIALYNSLKHLKPDGELYFFLPRSFLNVAAHRNIRKLTLENNQISIKLLGNAFKGVLSESILLHIKTDKNTKELFIEDKAGGEYSLPKKNITPPDYIISAESKAEDTAILEKIYNTPHASLEKNTIFALGVVTGNNEKHLLTKQSGKDKAEAIYRGKDIMKYTFSAPECFLHFQPELYQQIAPIEYYRQKKIAYRFISDKIICAIDNNNSLLLNSANFFIPLNYPMETITSLFNSNIYTFIFQKKYHSKKVLKSHLQTMPLPVFSKDTHKYISKLYHKTFLDNAFNKPLFQNNIDEIVCTAFSINKYQYNYIRSVCDRKS